LEQIWPTLKIPQVTRQIQKKNLFESYWNSDFTGLYF